MLSPESSVLSSTSFRSIVGQDHACEVLLSALRSERVPHAYLFVGSEGVGKKTVALEWAKILNCPNPVSPAEACGTCLSCRKIAAFNHPDVIWVDFQYQARLLGESAEKQRALKIDTVREMEHALRLKPLEGRVKIAFLEPADRLVDVAAHALLKILEEPPPQTHLVLLALDASQLLGTIRSRCQWVRFRPLPASLLEEHLRKNAPGVSEQEVRAAVLQSEGSLSRALKILETGEELAFDWETAPLSELLAWCEQFHNPRAGRAAAEDFLRRLLARCQGELSRGRRNGQSVRRVLDALHQIKQNVSPQLALEVLLLKLRWEIRMNHRK